jgi:hypothetical protein
MLKMDVFDSLAYRFAQVPLLFPIQTVNSNFYTTPLGTNANFNTALTTNLSFADSMWTVFREDGQHSTQRFINPYVSYTVNVNGKPYPPRPFETVEDFKSKNQTLDALNINNSQITSIPRDLRTSMQPYTRVQNFGAGGAKTFNLKYTTGSKSTYFFAIPFCDSEVFMGGLSTLSKNIQVQMIGHRLNIPKMNRMHLDTPIGLFLQDQYLTIRSIQPQGRPQIEIVNKTAPQILSQYSR